MINIKQIIEEFKKQDCIKTLVQDIDWGEIKIQVQNKEIKCITIEKTFKT